MFPSPQLAEAQPEPGSAGRCLHRRAFYVPFHFYGNTASCLIQHLSNKYFDIISHIIIQRTVSGVFHVPCYGACDLITTLLQVTVMSSKT